MSSDLFVTGTDTNVGKTLLSALLVAALERKYWKPIQTGSCEGTDRETVVELLKREQTHQRDEFALSALKVGVLGPHSFGFLTSATQ